MTTAAALAVLLPGPHHMLCPSCHGLTKIAPRTFTDAPPARHGALRRMVRKATARVRAFYGPLDAKPRLVLCATKQCLDTFSSGSQAGGVTFGWVFIRVAPRGLRASIIAHELMHAELHARLGLSGALQRPVPMWFDEGLAVLISGDRRHYARHTPKATAWVEALWTPSDWAAAIRRHGWLRVYAAATERVEDVERRIGRPGLSRVIARVSRGAKFADALAAEPSVSRSTSPNR